MIVQYILEINLQNPLMSDNFKMFYLKIFCYMVVR